METDNRHTVALTESQTIPGHVVVSRVHDNGKLYGVTIMSREELQGIVQQAHDLYGITADPFATPGSADAPTERSAGLPDNWLSALAREPRSFA